MTLVLLVDDDTTGLEIRKLILEHAGYQVMVASAPAAALDQCRAASPSIAILDLRLPNPEDGLALIRDLRSAHSSLRIIVLCGNSADLDTRPERALVDEVFNKPANAEQLLRAVAASSGC